MSDQIEIVKLLLENKNFDINGQDKIFGNGLMMGLN